MAEPPKETWLQWVALTTTILAVCAAISSLKASSYSTRVQIHTTKEANHWAYYQSKSIKEHSFQLNRDILNYARLLSSPNPQVQQFLAAKIKDYEKEINRYDQEKKQIKTEAETLIKEQEELKKHNAAFALAVMLLQIGIMMSAVAALIKRKMMWVAGLVLSAVGLVYMGNGFFLWF
jgi:cation transport ATPase